MTLAEAPVAEIIITAIYSVLLLVLVSRHQRKAAALEYRLSRARMAAWAYRQAAMHVQDHLLDVLVSEAPINVDAIAEAACLCDGDDLTAEDLIQEATP
tara:strand:- start:5 stop:301 length:297 start_codon:yes stop_codon:yes gene_type:complete